MQDQQSQRPQSNTTTSQSQGQGGYLPYQPRVRKTPGARYEARTDDAYGSGGNESYDNQAGATHVGVGEQLEERFEKFAEGEHFSVITHPKAITQKT
jgi:hypothetical protein